jgi:hypothetical protein
VFVELVIWLLYGYIGVCECIVILPSYLHTPHTFSSYAHNKTKDDLLIIWIFTKQCASNSNYTSIDLN